MDSMSGYEAEVADLMGRYRQKLADLLGLQRRVAESSATVASAGRNVRVTVNGQGEITALEFSAGAHRWLSAAELSEEILSAARDAKAKAREPLDELLKLDFLNGSGILELVQHQVDAAGPGRAAPSDCGQDDSGEERSLEIPDA
jgi:DNA-binding protein YbaB